MSEEAFVYLCGRLQDGVERIRDQVRHVEENPQEVTRPLIRLLTTKINSRYSDYEEYYSQLIDVCGETEVTAYEKKREEFVMLYRQTLQAIQSVEVTLLCPSMQYQPVVYVPVQFLRPQEPCIESEFIAAPAYDGELGCAVATGSPLVKPTPCEPTKVVIKVGEPSIPSLLNVIPTHELLNREHSSAVSKNPSPKVVPPPTVNSCCEPIVVTEPALSPSILISQSAKTYSQAILTEKSDSAVSFDDSPRSQAETYEVATSWYTAQCAVAAKTLNHHKPTKGKPCPGRDYQQVNGSFDRWSVGKPTFVDAKQYQRLCDRKWRFQQPRPPESKATSAAVNIYRRPEAVINPTKSSICFEWFLSEGFHPSAGGRMFGIHPNVVLYPQQHSSLSACTLTQRWQHQRQRTSREEEKERARATRSLRAIFDTRVKEPEQCGRSRELCY